MVVKHQRQVRRKDVEALDISCAVRLASQTRAQREHAYGPGVHPQWRQALNRGEERKVLRTEEFLYVLRANRSTRPARQLPALRLHFKERQYRIGTQRRKSVSGNAGKLGDVAVEQQDRRLFGVERDRDSLQNLPDRIGKLPLRRRHGADVGNSPQYGEEADELRVLF